MAIALAFKQNVQIVKLSGKLSNAEESAVRLKLDQKLAQGRKLFAFDLDGFDLQDKASIAGLYSLATFITTRESHCVLFGIKNHLWKDIVFPPGPDFKKYEVESEATQYLNSLTVAPPDKTAVPEKKQETTEDEIKRRNLEKLFELYEKYQISNDYDPLMLGKLEEEYKANKTRKGVVALKQAFEKIEERKQKRRDLDEAAQKEAQSLQTMMVQRKLPMTAGELESKRKSVLAAKAQVEKELLELRTELQKAVEEEASWKKKSQEHDLLWKSRLGQIQREIDMQTLEFKKQTEEMDRRDKEEDELLKKAAPPS